MKWLLILILLVGCQAEIDEPPAPEIPAEIRIVAMGDSLTAGYGLDESDAYPAQLEAALVLKGYDVEVLNAGISGETSSGALTRLDWVLSLEPDVLILETGPNDGLRGIDPSLTEENIDAMLTRLKEEDVVVILAGMQIVQNMGPTYVDAFKAIYPTLAEKHNVILIPFFLEGVAADDSLNQNDQIHPTAEGYTVIVQNILPYVEESLAEN